jgi:hypothetical protein
MGATGACWEHALTQTSDWQPDEAGLDWLTVQLDWLTVQSDWLTVQSDWLTVQSDEGLP